MESQGGTFGAAWSAECEDTESLELEVKHVTVNARFNSEAEHVLSVVRRPIML